MGFELIKKGRNKTSRPGFFRLTRNILTIERKLRKKKKGFFGYANLYIDGSKVAIEFTDDSFTGYSVLNNRIVISSIKQIKDLPRGDFEYVKKGRLYVIDTKDASKGQDEVKE